MGGGDRAMIGTSSVATTRRARLAPMIELHPDIVPFSNIPAWLPPFLLDTSRAMRVA